MFMMSMCISGGRETWKNMNNIICLIITEQKTHTKNDKFLCIVKREREGANKKAKAMQKKRGKKENHKNPIKRGTFFCDINHIFPPAVSRLARYPIPRFVIFLNGKFIVFGNVHMNIL